MKIRRFLAGAIVMAAALFTGCVQEEPLGLPDVTLGATDLEFTKDAGSQEINVTATREWKVEYDAEWVAVTPDRGQGSNEEQTLTVTVTENTKGNRTAKVTVTIGMVAKSFNVNQAGPEGATDGVESLTVKEFIEKADTENYYRLTGKVSGFNATYCSFDITDETGKIYVYSVTEESKTEWTEKIKNGGTVVLQGKYLYYESKSQHEVVDAIIESFTEEGEDNGNSEPVDAVYYNDFDKEEAVKGDKGWPYLDQFDGWKNQTGSGAEGVSFSFNGMSARSNSTSDSSYSDYDGSGMNNMFFGKEAYIATYNIALGTAVNFTLSFGTEKYDGNNKEAQFDPEEFHVWLSADGVKWVELEYSFAGTAAGRWNVASADFTVPAGTEKLSVCMVADAASVYRMDDMKLVAADKAGTTIDFTAGVEKDFGAPENNNDGGNDDGGNDDGNGNDGGNDGAESVYSNDFDKTTSSKTNDKWPYCDEFDGWKNEKGSGAADVTYAFKSASPRATSGDNNIWLPKSGAYLAVQDIALGGATSFELSFNVICGSPGNYKKQFNSSVFKVWLSADKAKWVELPVTVTANDQEFDDAVATFSVPASTTTLSIAFEKIADETDGYRIDNVNLVTSTATGTAVDFTQGVDKNFGASSDGGSDNGDGGSTTTTQPTSLTKVTIAEFKTKPVNDTDWYELTGEITEIQKEEWGNFVIKDATGEILIYGMTSKWVGSNDKSFSQIGLKVGDIVTLGTLRSEYQGTAQGGGNKIPAYYISHTAGGDAGNDGGGNTDGGDTDGGGDTGNDDNVVPEDPSKFETQDITWTLGEKAYEQEGVVNGVEVSPMLKLSTSKIAGDLTLHVPAGTKKVGLYLIGWKETETTFKATVGESEVASLTPRANEGATGNPPYTITVTNEDYYEIEVNASEAVDMKIEANGRVIFFGLKAIKE